MKLPSSAFGGLLTLGLICSFFFWGRFAIFCKGYNMSPPRGLGAKPESVLDTV